MSNVFRAHDRLLERSVALKILHEHYSADEDYVERFRREARSVAQLAHPNIVTVIDRGEQDGRQYIVFEYVEGENLKGLLSHGALPVDEALRYALQIAGALDFAHKRGLVHRDVKPQNVLLTEEGEPKVTDFGIARSRRRPERDAVGHRRRDERLHRSRAGARRAGRRRDRHLLARRRALRAADRRGAVLGRQLRRRRDAAPARARPERARSAARRSGSARPRGAARDGEGPGRPLRIDGGADRRARPVLRRAGLRRRGDEDRPAATPAARDAATAPAARDSVLAHPARRRCGGRRRLPVLLPTHRACRSWPRTILPARSGCRRWPPTTRSAETASTTASLRRQRTAIRRPTGAPRSTKTSPRTGVGLVLRAPGEVALSRLTIRAEPGFRARIQAGNEPQRAVRERLG